MAMQYFPPGQGLVTANKWEGGCPELQSQINNFARRGELVPADVLEAGTHLEQWAAAEKL